MPFFQIFQGDLISRISQNRFSAGYDFADFREFNQNTRNTRNLIPAKFNPIKVSSSKKLLLFGEGTIETTSCNDAFQTFSKRLLKLPDINYGE